MCYFNMTSYGNRGLAHTNVKIGVAVVARNKYYKSFYETVKELEYKKSILRLKRWDK